MNSKAPPPLDSSSVRTLCIFHVPPAEDTCPRAADGAAALRLAALQKHFLLAAASSVLATRTWQGRT